MGNCCSCFDNCCSCLGCDCCCRLGGCCSCLYCSCCATKLTLPQNDPDMQDRKKEVDEEREIYQFTPYGGVNGMPLILKGKAGLIDEFTFQQLGNLSEVALKLVKGNISGDIKEWFAQFGKEISPLDEYQKLFKKVPAIANTWQRDSEFGYLRLAGLNPTRIFQINLENIAEKLAPGRFNVTDELLEGVLPSGLTLEKLASTQRLFMTESPETEGMELKTPGAFVTSPIVLYWLNENTNQILPLAIQLYADPSKGAGRIYTPKDHSNLWLAAKLHVAYCDMMIHSFTEHVCSQHTMMESVWIAIRRCFSEKHPLRAFFTPHFYQLLVVNWGIRGTLDTDGALERLTGIKHEGIAEMVRRKYQIWSMEQIDPEVDFARRGVESIPEYYFRDDSKAYFDVFKRYAKSIVNLIYTTGNDMHADYELKMFLSELDGIGVKGAPKADSPDELALFIARIVYHSTVRHSYVETAGFSLYAYPPANPLKFTLPPEQMTADAQLTPKEIQSHLATMEEASKQISLIGSVEIRAGDSYYLGNYNCRYLAGLPGAQSVVEGFVKDLKDVGARIEKRNSDCIKNNKRPFTYLELKDLYSSIWN